MSTSYQLDPQDFGTTLKDQLIELVISQRDSSERHDRAFREGTRSLYDLWRGYSTGSIPLKNNVWIPLIFSTIQTDVARKMSISFGQWPAIGFSGEGPEDKPIALQMEALINAQLMDANVLAKEYKTFLGADLYGTAVSQVFWDHKVETHTRSEMLALPLSQDTVRIRKKQNVVTFDGPNYRNVDLMDFYPQPGFREIHGNEGMPRCGVRYTLDLDDCRFLASNEGGNIFDKSEVNRLHREGGSLPASRLDEPTSRFHPDQDFEPGFRHRTDKATRTVVINEMWGEIPTEFRKYFKGASMGVVSVANEKFLLRARPLPYDNLVKPFVAFCPVPDPHRFHGVGKGEISAQLQIAGNRFVNHQLDAGDLLVHPALIVNRDMNIDTRNLWLSPGRVFGADGPPNQAIAPLQMDYKALQAGAQMASEMWSFIQMGTGINESTGMGMPGPDRETARGYLGRQEAASGRLLLESILYETQYLQPLANFFQAYNNQFLSLPRTVSIIGESAFEDPDTGEPIQRQRLDIDPSVINKQYASIAQGSSIYLSREAEKANFMQIFQIVAAAGPETQGAFNMVNFLRQLFRLYGVKNVNDFIQKQPSVQEQMAQMNGESGGNAPPGGMGMEMMGGMGG